jgi:hypothetical protein
MKPSSSSSLSSLLLSAGRQHEPILVETAIPCGGADIAHHWQSSSSSSSSSLQSSPLLSSSQSSSSTATLFQLVATSATVGSVAALLGLASLDAHLIITVHTTPNNGGAGGIFFALAWSGLTALAAYLIFERLVTSPKSKAAAAAAIGTNSNLLVELGATNPDETPYRLLLQDDDEQPNDDTVQCELRQTRHASKQHDDDDSRSSTVFVWGTYVSFSVTCLVHDIVVTTTTTTTSDDSVLPHYYWWWYYGAVTAVTILAGAASVVFSQCTTLTMHRNSRSSSNSNSNSSLILVTDNDHNDQQPDPISVCAPVTV